MTSKLRWMRTIRFRLTFWYTLLLGTLLAICGVGLYFACLHLLLAETDSFLDSEVARVTSFVSSQDEDSDDNPASEAPVDVGSTTPLAQRLHQLRPYSHVSRDLVQFDTIYVRVLDARDGTVLAESPGLTRGHAASAALAKLWNMRSGPVMLSAQNTAFSHAYAGSDEENILRVSSASFRVRSRQMVCIVAVPWDHNFDILERLFSALMVGIPLITLFAAFGGWLLVRYTLQPIHRIVSSAENVDVLTMPPLIIGHHDETDSEIGQLVDTLNRMLGRIHNAFEAEKRMTRVQQQFAADASHELRTPLTILRGEVELTLNKDRPREAYQSTLRSALEEIEKMSNIVQGLTMLSRNDLTPSDNSKAFTLIDLNDLLQSVLNESAHAATNNGIMLTSRLSIDSPSVDGDRVLLRHLFINLVYNAIKYTGSGGTVHVSTRYEASSRVADPGCVVVSVIDNGIGIAPDDLPHVFDRFWRADRSRSSEGTGLGLSICKRIAEQHASIIEIDSEVGRGTTVTVTFPQENREPLSSRA